MEDKNTKLQHTENSDAQVTLCPPSHLCSHDLEALLTPLGRDWQ